MNVYFGLMVVETTCAMGVIFGVLTVLWGFGIDIPRLKAEKSLVYVGRYKFTHHWFEHPLYFFMGFPIGGISILFAEVISPGWGLALMVTTTVVVALILKYVGRHARAWLNVKSDSHDIRRVQLTLMASYLIGLAVSLGVFY